MPDTREFQSRMQHVDDLLRQAEEKADPATQAQLQELATSLFDLHGLALRRMLEQIFECNGGDEIVDALAHDEMISPLLVLHGLHPFDAETRVRGALEKVGPYLASHGGHVELISVAPDGAVHLRLEGSCHGCPSSRVTLQSTIEQEIYRAAPEVCSIVVEGLVEEEPPAHAGFVPIEQIGINGNLLHAAASS